MRTYKLTIAYDGTAYQGWQRQANTENTLQGTLERTISSVAGYPVEIDGSGRTDAGVHANGQTATVVLSGRVEDGFFTEKINSRLPEDIRILDAELVRNGFHATSTIMNLFPTKFSFLRVDTTLPTTFPINMIQSSRYPRS